MEPRPTEELSALCAQRDAMWAHMRKEAEDALRLDPALAPLFVGELLNRDSLEAAVIHRVSERLGNSDVSADLIRQAFGDALDVGLCFVAFLLLLALYIHYQPAWNAAAMVLLLTFEVRPSLGLPCHMDSAHAPKPASPG